VQIDARCGGLGRRPARYVQARTKWRPGLAGRILFDETIKRRFSLCDEIRRSEGRAPAEDANDGWRGMGKPTGIDRDKRLDINCPVPATRADMSVRPSRQCTRRRGAAELLDGGSTWHRTNRRT
jgi:hypothetical protein